MGCLNAMYRHGHVSGFILLTVFSLFARNTVAKVYLYDPNLVDLYPVNFETLLTTKNGERIIYT